jgi:uncharacterized damage-inducible protein DinB
MNPIQAMIQELQQEAQTTRKLLSTVPNDKLTWKPHEKSMTLGQLANHVASIPARVSSMLTTDSMDVSKASFTPPQATSRDEILNALEVSVAQAVETLEGWDSAKVAAPWTLLKGEQVVFTMPRVGAARSILMNHIYHHRGQLTVYLRLLDVPLPVTYGRSADVNPFA